MLYSRQLCTIRIAHDSYSSSTKKLHCLSSAMTIVRMIPHRLTKIAFEADQISVWSTQNHQLMCQRGDHWCTQMITEQWYIEEWSTKVTSTPFVVEIHYRIYDTIISTRAITHGSDSSVMTFIITLPLIQQNWDVDSQARNITSHSHSGNYSRIHTYTALWFRLI
jgi:hypothetical protein